MCEECPMRSQRVQSAEFLEQISEDLALMAQGKKHNVIDTFLANNWSGAFADAAKELRKAEQAIADTHKALGVDYDAVIESECRREAKE